MNLRWRSPLLVFAVGLSIWPSARARQTAADPAATPPAAGAPKFSQADLQKLAAPIALYPDPLVALILPASVYPLEIVQAARFVADTNNIAKLDDQPWDENVREVAKFPAVIKKMNDEVTWTMDLGQAFLDQSKELMDAIQVMRLKAQTAGVLQTTPQQIVVVTNTIIEKTVEQQVVYVTNTIVQIQPSNPQVIYVPTYPPTIYYPPPNYVYNPYAPLITFGVGIAVGAIIANNCNWHSGGVYVGHHGVAVWGGGGYQGGNVNVNVNKNVNINNTTINNANINNVNRNTSATQPWQPDQSRLRTSGAPGSMASAKTAEARGWNSGGPTTRPAASTGSTFGGTRPSTTPAFSQPGGSQARPTTGQTSTRPPTSPSSSFSKPASGAAPRAPTSRPATSAPVSRPTQSAFGGVNSGSSARSASSRGGASRGGGGGRGR